MAQKRRASLIVEYDGTNYAGWQRQINAMSVQQRLEEALTVTVKRHRVKNRIKSFFMANLRYSSHSR